MAMSKASQSKLSHDISANDFAQLFKITSEQLHKDLNKAGIPSPYKSLIPPQIARAYLQLRGYKIPKQVVSFQMLKGGVAKTTTALNFGLRASMYGVKVLMLDLDQQANLTYALDVDTENLPVWVDVVEKKVKIQDAIQKITDYLHIIPSSLNNSVLDRILMQSHRNWVQTVKGPLSDIKKNYDLILIDTAPSLSLLNTAVTCASDLVVLPINPDKFSMLGVKKHLQDLSELSKEFDLKFKKKILFTRYDGREQSSQQILNQCIDLFDELLMKNYVRSSSEVKNVIGSGKTIFNSKSPVKEDYDLVTREILNLEI